MNNPQFSYFLSSNSHPVRSGDRLWDEPLPLNRTNQQTDHGDSLSYGEYFSAISAFLKKGKYEVVRGAVSELLSNEITQKDINEISVYLEKHGGFYHPSRIKMIVDGAPVQFVLNVAVSDAGRNCIEKEFEALQKLNKNFPYRYIPKVYVKGDVSIRNSRKISMFMGEWFDDYHEFHISKTNESERSVSVWDPVKGKYVLSRDQAKEVYRQIAMILTGYYNPETCEQVYPWHNAAGDFVLKKEDDDRIKVKLITVRQYASYSETTEAKKISDDIQSILHAMLVFFLNLSIRIRLDRMDGIGDVVWGDDIAVQGVVDGFFEGLKGHPSSISVAAPLCDYFLFVLLNCNEQELYDLSLNIADAYNPASPDVPLIRQNLTKHTRTLHREIQNLKM